MQLQNLDIKNILYNVPNQRGVMDLMAPQEVDRLVDIIYGAFEQSLTNSNQGIENNVGMINSIKSIVIEEIKNNQDAFGISELNKKLDLNTILQEIIQAETSIPK